MYVERNCTVSMDKKKENLRIVDHRIQTRRNLPLKKKCCKHITIEDMLKCAQWDSNPPHLFQKYFTFENSNEKQKHNMKSLSGIQSHLPLKTLLKRNEVDDN